MATGLDVTKMLPIPSLDNHIFDQARKYEERGYGNVLFTWNPEEGHCPKCNALMEEAKGCIIMAD